MTQTKQVKSVKALKEQVKALNKKTLKTKLKSGTAEPPAPKKVEPLPEPVSAPVVYKHMGVWIKDRSPIVFRVTENTSNNIVNAFYLSKVQVKPDAQGNTPARIEHISFVHDNGLTVMHFAEVQMINVSPIEQSAVNAPAQPSWPPHPTNAVQ